MIEENSRNIFTLKTFHHSRSFLYGVVQSIRFLIPISVLNVNRRCGHVPRTCNDDDAPCMNPGGDELVPDAPPS